MPFVGCNLLLSHSVHIKTFLQATSYEKISAVALCFPLAPGQRPSIRAQGEAAGMTVWGGQLGGLLEPQRFSSQSFVVQTAMRGLGTRLEGLLKRKRIFC